MAFDWRRLVMAVYLTGAVVLVLRLFLGWLTARRLIGASEYVPAVRAYQSSQILAPMTIGVFSPRVVLPADWRNWSEETLAAVLLHEREHVSRRDTAVTVMARINTCLLWFHPLAWGLERILATTAEFACDAAAVRRLGARER